jgi:hypothetical protein
MTMEAAPNCALTCFVQSLSKVLHALDALLIFTPLSTI